ncbi:hypothetical protein AgCh_032134 [Apium graveolens]
MKKKFNIKWWLAQHKNQSKDSVDVDESEGYVGYPLTAEEQEEKEQLLEEGFSTWSKKDFNSFIRACEKYGRNDVKGNASEMEGKTEEEVERYAEVFKERYKDLNVMHDSQLGYGNWDELKAVFRTSPLFRFDWFVKSRSTIEFAWRCDTLIRLVEKENQDFDERERQA